MASASSILRSSIDKLRGDFFFGKIDRGRIPAHVAVIMDGNGRWAKLRGRPRIEGHRAGAETIRAVVQAAIELGVKYLTLYTFSSENWQRPREEVSALMGLFKEMLEREIDQLDLERVRVRVIGRLDDLPAATRGAFRSAMEKTGSNERLHLVLALNYSGRMEIADAAAQLAHETVDGRRTVNTIDPEAVAAHLYAPEMPDPDLLIRTGGDVRVSNFLLWQIAYTEIWVTKKLWPDFRRADFLAAVADFQRRERRFGRVESDG